MSCQGGDVPVGPLKKCSWGELTFDELTGDMFNGAVPEHQSLLVLVRWMTEAVEPPLTDDELVRLADVGLKAISDELTRRGRHVRGITQVRMFANVRDPRIANREPADILLARREGIQLALTSPT